MANTVQFNDPVDPLLRRDQVPLRSCSKHDSKHGVIKLTSSRWLVDGTLLKRCKSTAPRKQPIPWLRPVVLRLPWSFSCFLNHAHISFI
eukprot:UN21170